MVGFAGNRSDKIFYSWNDDVSEKTYSDYMSQVPMECWIYKGT